MILPASFRLIHNERVASTNDEARRLAGEGAGHGTVVFAEEQTAGRGRRGRVWQSPKGNLHCSVLVDSPHGRAREAELAFVASVALRDAMAPLAPRAVFTCKWPNDVLCDGAKISGMLLESADTKIILGVGVNVVEHPTDTPYPTMSLKRAGASVTSLDLLALFCAQLGHWYGRWSTEGFAPIRAAWMERAAGLGKGIKVNLADTTSLDGKFAGLDDNGALMLELPGGGRRPILAGDVFFAE